MTQLALIARLQAKPGRRDDLLETLSRGVSAVGEEPGTLLYLMHTDEADDDLVWFYELYSHDAAFDDHRTSETMKAMKPVLGELLAAPVEITRGRLVGGKGLRGTKVQPA